MLPAKEWAATARRDNDGFVIDDTTEIAPPLLAGGWLLAWSTIGGSVTISTDGRHLHPWVMFTSDTHAPGVAAHLMRELHDTPGLPRAIRAVLTERLKK
ncbi:hypothetical protein [Novosphingobium capsulatum]|uniref:hypothetical protein n=1 Tax=Novosphingobium capsulatum TaxID=13688 RepID=UPI000786BE0D|nr:hypothetical protein [Novosphingobium capsulatum]WQD92739.1 hypothetical protein U0041_17420 [Novosphingobium capsulatum]